MRTLVIDDDPHVCALINRCLGKAQVVTETNPLVAVQMIESGARFDYILCDLRMPQMNGIEVLTRIQAIDKACCTVLVTGDDVPRSEWSGRLLRKPFGPGDIRRLIPPR